MDKNRSQDSKARIQQKFLRAQHAILLLFLCLFLLSACPRSQEGDIKEDLTRYMEQARKWAIAEEQINNAVIAVRRTQFVDDNQTINILKPVVGIAQEYVQQLDSYHPSSQPLRNVHQEYIEAWRAHYLAIAAIIDAVEKKDYIQLAKVNKDLFAAQRSVSDALEDLARLLQNAGLRMERPSSQRRPPSPLPSPESPAPSQGQ